MLDTVIITIPRGKYSIRNPYVFRPPAHILDGQGNLLVKCVCNPTATDKENDIYKPRLTLIKRMTRNGVEIPLKIEFSVPKMIYKNNVDEVEESDFETVVQALRRALDSVGVIVPSEEIRNASVSAFHPSKNIPLSKGFTSSFVINELAKLNPTMRLDLNKANFRNNGRSLQFYANSHSMVMYDKAYDLNNTENRAMDKDQNYLQHSLFEVLNEKHNIELFRLEIRLQKKVKMNAVLSELGFPENPSFKQVFRKEICQKILQHYWEEFVTGQNLFLFDVKDCPLKMFEKLLKSGIKPKEAMYLVGLATLCKKGIRDTRAIVERHAHKRSWLRYSKGLRVLDNVSSKKPHDWVKQINKALADFTPFKLSTL